MRVNQLTKIIKQDIEAGKLGKSGARFLTARELGDSYGTSFVTALKAITILKKEHYLMSVGSKNYICTGLYSYNSELHRLINKDNNKIGLHVRDMTNPYISAVSEKLNFGLVKKGFVPLILSSSNDAKQEIAALEFLLDQGCKGIFSFISHETDDVINIYNHYPLPTVLLGRRVRDIGVSYVASDNFHSGVSAAKHLADYAYDKFVYISSRIASEATSDERLQGFKQGLEQLGHSLDAELIYDSEEPASRLNIINTVRKLCRQHRTGIFCYHDLIASGVYWLLKESSISVPDEAGIIGYDNLPAVTPLRLTTFAYNFNEVANTAITIMSEKLKTLSALSQYTEIPTILTVRGSTARPT